MLTAQEWHQTYLEIIQHGNKIDHMEADFFCYEQQNLIIPATLAHPLLNNSYIVSPLTLVTAFAKDEIPKVRFAILRWFSHQLIIFFSKPLQLAGVGHVQTLNNQCLSTNMYSKGWMDIDLITLRKQALKKTPENALLLRSLNVTQHADIIRHCEQDGWISIVTRQVYLHNNWQKVVAGKDLKNDLRLLKQPQWKFKKISSEHDIQCAKSLYDQLYLDKYSQHNIRFTLSYFKQFSQSGLISLYGLFYQDKMLATVGIIVIEGDMTCPILGYDLQQPQKLALYRRASAFTIDYAKKHDLRFNMSSGAPQFKRNRKAKPSIEYSYVYCLHLSRPKQIVWKVFSWLTKYFYRPILEKQQL